MTRPALIYDGDCPFCANYVELLKLRERWPDLELINARDTPTHPAVQQVRRSGKLLDDGMALVIDGRIHHGADAIHQLSKKGGSLNRTLFGSSDRSRLLYPFLRAGRNAALILLGRKKLGF